MEKFEGYLFAKLALVGSDSEGPKYFLQRLEIGDDDAFDVVIKKVQLWEEDPALHPFLNRRVRIEGTMSMNGIEYQTIS